MYVNKWLIYLTNAVYIYIYISELKPLSYAKNI